LLETERERERKKKFRGVAEVKAVVFTASGFYFSTGGAFGPGLGTLGAFQLHLVIITYHDISSLIRHLPWDRLDPPVGSPTSRIIRED